MKNQKIRINLPSLQKQKEIAIVIENINSKINVNEKINDNLEKQLNLLFSAFISNTINWTKGRLRDLLYIKRNTISAKDVGNLPYLPIDSIPMNSLAIEAFRPSNEAQSSLLSFNKDDILIGAMRVYFHRVTIAPCNGVTRSTCFVLQPYDSAYLYYSLLLCNQDSTISYAQRTSKGTTMPYAIWENGLGDMEIAIPPINKAKEFNQLIMPLINKIQNSYYEQNQLKTLRDYLLPRLLNGQITLP